ncbi:hypothetical protein V6N11_054995 [Hibiscus sabdariffa]|uniref:RNase H type-1 domain-containing protein n=1 Tax=Hibiscus sabdariffa TaxID=183260 RepID=A0ABR2P3W9_9ROSI
MVLSSLERSENSSGNGEHVDFWRDSWLVDVSPLHTHILRNMVAHLLSCSVASMTDGNGDWKCSCIISMLPMQIKMVLSGLKMASFRFSLVSSIHSLLNKDWDVLIQVGHRSTNKVADLLARIGRVEERNVTSSGPSRIFLRP